jgi:hypothetical protein
MVRKRINSLPDCQLVGCLKMRFQSSISGSPSELPNAAMGRRPICGHVFVVAAFPLRMCLESTSSCA